MFRHACLAVAIAVAAGTLPGCVYYGPYVAPAGSVVPASFDRSFDAATGALVDSSFTIIVHDRAGGTIVGRAGATDVTCRVLYQADGSVRVEITAADAAVAARVSAAYERRMGR